MDNLNLHIKDTYRGLTAVSMYFMFNFSLILLLIQGCATIGNKNTKHGEGIIPLDKIAFGRNLIVEAKFEDAQNHFNMLQTQYKNSVEARLWYVNTLIIQGKFNDAEERIKSLITSFPQSYKLHAKLAELYERAAMRDVGKTYFSKLLDQYPHASYVYGPYMQLLRAGGEYDKAIALSQRILEHNPNDFDSLKSLAISYFFKGKMRLSDMIARQALNIQADDAELLNVRGLIEVKQSNYSEAMSYFSKAFEIDSAEPNVCFNVASVALRFGNYGEALKGFNAFISIHPENRNGVAGRGIVSAKNDKENKS